MKTNLEIEFKTKLTKSEYDNLISHFNLSQNVFSQTNYYFDSTDNFFNKREDVLRIRYKSLTNIKITFKKKQPIGLLETDFAIDIETMNDYLVNGFNLKHILGLDLHVFLIAELTTNRAKCPWKSGSLFLDHSLFYGQEDYELEYEALHHVKGKTEFQQTLKQLGLKYYQTPSKIRRALLAKENK